MPRYAPAHGYLSLRTVEAAARAAAERNVSQKARGRGGFVAAYRKAAGRPTSLSEKWAAKRDGFVARFVAGRGAMWKGADPSKKHLALAVWAYSPDAPKLRRWLVKHGYLTPTRYRKRNPESPSPDRTDVRSVHAALERHLTQKCGVPTKDVQAILPKVTAKTRGTTRPALTARGLKLWDDSVPKHIENPVIRIILQLLPLTGMRIGALCGMTWNALRDGKLHYVGKQGKPRIVSLSPHALDLLGRYEKAMVAMGRDIRDQPFIFPNWRKQYRIDPGRVRRAVNRMHQQVPELDGVTPHVLRHTWASLAVARCVDLTEVSEHLGHDSMRTTLGYLHPGAFTG